MKPPRYAAISMEDIGLCADRPPQVGDVIHWREQQSMVVEWWAVPSPNQPPALPYRGAVIAVPEEGDQAQFVVIELQEPRTVGSEEADERVTCDTCLIRYVDTDTGCPLCALEKALRRPDKADLNRLAWVLVYFMRKHASIDADNLGHWLADLDSPSADALWLQPLLAILRDQWPDALAAYRAAGGVLEPDYLGIPAAPSSDADGRPPQ